jgi:hypothetical protein
LTNIYANLNKPGAAGKELFHREGNIFSIQHSYVECPSYYLDMNVHIQIEYNIICAVLEE